MYVSVNASFCRYITLSGKHYKYHIKPKIWSLKQKTESISFRLPNPNTNTI